MTKKHKIHFIIFLCCLGALIIISYITFRSPIINLGFSPATGEFFINIEEFCESETRYYAQFREKNLTDSIVIVTPKHELKYSCYNWYGINKPIKIEIFGDENIIYENEIQQNKRGILILKNPGESIEKRLFDFCLMFLAGYTMVMVVLNKLSYDEKNLKKNNIKNKSYDRELV